MKLGFICEGEKTDGSVLRMLLAAEFPEATLEIVATSKAAIFMGVGALVDELLSQGCERVIVAWDLHPIGTQMSVNSQSEHEDPCQRDQRKTLLAIAERTAETCRGDVMLLQQRYGFSEVEGDPEDARVCLVCFCESFDAVFLSDPGLLRALASSDVREADAPPNMRSPVTAKRPQEVLRQYFRRGHNKRLKYFNKCEHNVVLAQEFIGRGKLNKLRKHPGYKRLVTVIETWVSASASRATSRNSQARPIRARRSRHPKK